MALFAGTHSFSPERGVVPFPRHRFHQPTLICHQLNRSVDPHRSYIGRVGLDVMKWPAAARRGVRQHPSLANRFPQGQRGWLSPAHDVSGRGSARSARQLWPFWEGLDARTGRLQGCAWQCFRTFPTAGNRRSRTRKRRRSSWGARADVPALDGIGFVSPKCQTRHLRKGPYEEPLNSLAIGGARKDVRAALSPEGTASARRSIK